MNFAPEELAPIEAALAAVPPGDQRDRIMVKICRHASDAADLAARGQPIIASEDHSDLAKVVYKAVEAMTKRTKGAPLSEAELEQRREAGKKSHGGVSAGVATGAALGGAAGAALGRRSAMLASHTTTESLRDRAISDRYRAGRKLWDDANDASVRARAKARSGNPFGTQESLKASRKSRDAALRMIGNAENLPAETETSIRRAGMKSGLKSYARSGAKGALVGALGGATYGANRYFDKASPSEMRKAMADLPLAQRSHAEALMMAGQTEQLQKFLAPALMAARAALPTVSRAAGGVGTRLFGAQAGARAAGAVMSGGRSAIRGGIAAERGIKAGAGALASGMRSGMGAARAMGARAAGVAGAGFGRAKSAISAMAPRARSMAGGAAMLAGPAADAAGAWGKRNKRGLAIGAGAAAAGGAGAAAYGATRPQRPRQQY
jgi:hypothetical protein